VASPSEHVAMRRALTLACTPGVPLGPNPRVGAVLLDDSGTVIAEGFHRGAGTDHAEADALMKAGDSARGATAVVTLEPCNHTGRTGPCAVALIDAGVRRVVYAQADLTPRARGGGERLMSAGVEVEAGLLVDEAAKLNRAWSFASQHRRPFVTWKFAATLDGRSAAADGTSMWITSEDVQRDVHRQRAECDVVLVGTGTIIADNARLTVRDEFGEPVAGIRQPLRAVMGLRDIPDDAAVLDQTASTVHLRTRDPRRVLDELYARDRQHVWLEGGPTVAAAFVTAGLVDEVIAYIAPAFLGAGRSAIGDLGIATIDHALRLTILDVTRIGDDIRLIMRSPDHRGSS
jgi:diaminohydroxyphosphoribosylaminopyrimidine deaminase/5-amino-6-(5-phosphoribosylamino)uracil reductase